MERIILIIIAGILMIPNANAQSGGFELDPAPGYFIHERVSDQLYLEARELEIWSEDFENGIPISWSNEETGGIASWEYRGPDTTPGIESGSRGSCIPEGQSAGSPIQSETDANGFVIFDSNYWDDNIGPCGNMGSGPAPAPHNAYLTTESIDLSSFDKVGVLFTQYHKNFDATTELQVSINGGEWDTVISNNFSANQTTELGQIERKNISEYVGGESDVRLRFAFEGQYYFWMIDDIILFELDDNNLIIESSTYGDFNELSVDIMEEMKRLEYSEYPDEMPPYLYFSTDIVNYGAETQTNVQLHVTVRNESTLEVLLNDTSEAQDVSSDDAITLSLNEFQMPGTIGEYVIDMSVLQSEIDESPDNNFTSKDFNITDVTYSRDLLSTDGIYVPSSIFNGDSYETGNFFYITESNQSLYSMSVGVGLGSVTGSDIHGALYTMDFDSFETTLIAETESEEVYWEALNNMGDNQMMVLNFNEPVELTQNVAYLLMVVCPEGPSDVIFATSGDCPAFSSMVRFGANQWFYMVRTPMVRMNFGNVVTVEESSSQTKFKLGQNYPNPFFENTRIDYTLDEPQAVRISITDNSGKIIQVIDEGKKGFGDHSLTIPGESLAPGVYTYTMKIGNKTKSRLMMISE